eukprot:COSAG04_NODE_987_length_8947_cov_6.409245_3_plen_84_part_00
MNGGGGYSHVDVADIALLQLVSVRHPMANHLRGKGFLRIQFAAQREIFWAIGIEKNRKELSLRLISERGGRFVAENPNLNFEF